MCVKGGISLSTSESAAPMLFHAVATKSLNHRISAYFSQVSQFNGFYQSQAENAAEMQLSACLTYSLFRFEPLFYHKSFDRFVPWEQREKTMAPRRQIIGSPYSHYLKGAKLLIYREDWEDFRRFQKFQVFSCTMGCSAHNLTAKEAHCHSLNTFHVAALRGVATLRCGSQDARHVKLLAL